MDALTQPVVVLSDVHLRAGTDWPEALRRLRGLWQGAATVVFNGDTVSRTIAQDARRRAEVVDALTALCASDGVRPVLLGGNTDYPLTDLRHVYLAGGRVLVTHGDVILDEISPWHGRGRQIAAARAEAIGEMPPERRDTLEGQLHAATEAIARTQHLAPLRRYGEGTATQRTNWYLRWLRRPRAVWSVLSFWRRMPHLAAQFITRYAPDARMIVIGHAHKPGVWTVAGRRVINTGCFEAPWARARVVRVEGSAVEVRKVVKSKGQWLPGPVVACYDVAADCESQSDPKDRSTT